MELSWIFAAILVFGVAVAAFFFLGRFGKKRREMSRAGLHRRASEEAESLRAFVDEREAKRPERDSVVKDHDLPSHRVTLHEKARWRCTPANTSPKSPNFGDRRVITA